MSFHFNFSNNFLSPNLARAFSSSSRNFFPATTRRTIPSQIVYLNQPNSNIAQANSGPNGTSMANVPMAYLLQPVVPVQTPTRPTAQHVELNTNDNFQPEYYEGLEHIKKRKFGDAVKSFQKAFYLDKNAKYLALIAICYKNVNSFVLAMNFIEKAIELEPNNDKFYAFAGKMQVNLYKNTRKRDCAHKAADFFSMAYQIAPSEANSSNYFEIRKFLHAQKLAKKNEEFSEIKQYLESSKPDKDPKRPAQAECDRQCLSKGVQNFMVDPKRLDQQKTDNIPSFMEDVISMEVIKNPMITSSGNTFEKEMILHHCKTNGYTDPISRKEIRLPSELIPNKHLKAMIHDYHIKYPGSYNPDQDSSNLEFVEFA